MADVPIDVVGLLDITHTNRQFPRKRWDGKLMVYLGPEGARRAGNGSVIWMEVEPSGSKKGVAKPGELFRFTAAIEEMPVLRLPEGIKAAAIVSRPAGLDFGNERMLGVRSASIVAGYVGSEEPVKPGGPGRGV